MKIPEPINSLSALIDKAHEDRQEPPRPHLGASTLGHPCDRWLWLSFRWAVVEKFQGRVLRLFRRGQNEEAQIVSDLRSIGINIVSTGGAQSRVDFGYHVSGSLDGVITHGVPEAPAKKHIAEFKTHSKKSFDDLVKSGVKASKPMHYIQMQAYMMGKKIDRALYVGVCKDDDRIYTERVRLDNAVAEKAVSRGKRITMLDRMPEPCAGAAPDWYQCKFCPAHSFCHDTKLTKEVNCRTCAHSTATPDSKWTCARYDNLELEAQNQRTGCNAHVLHPDLVPWQRVDSESLHDATYIIDGKSVNNGVADCNCFSSKEMVANPSACANPTQAIIDTRMEFDARIVG